MMSMSMSVVGQGEEYFDETAIGMETGGTSFFDTSGHFFGGMSRKKVPLADLDDGFASVNELHDKFEVAISSMTSRLNVFEMVDEWLLHIERGMAVPRHLDLDIPDSVHQKLHNILKREYETWDLIKLLYFERLNIKDGEEPQPFQEPIYDMYHLDERTYVEKIIRGDKSLQEMDSIIAWLELNYSRKSEPELVRKYIVWEQTLETLKRDQLLGKTTTTMVSHLDLDAVAREKKQLHPLDAEEEIRILRGTYHYLRAGSFEKAMTFLAESGHLLKARALAGSLYTQMKPKVKQEHPEEDGFVVVPTESEHTSIPTASEYPPQAGLQPKTSVNYVVVGNRNRDMWKNISWQVCEAQRLSKWDRIITGCVCHHRQSMLEVAQTWEDKLWSYLKTAIAVNVEKRLRGLTVARNHVQLPAGYWAQGMSLEEVFSELDGSEQRNVFDVDYLFQLLQKCVMLNRLEIFLETLQNNIEGLFNSIEHDVIYDHVVRFLTHVLLVFAICDLPYSEELTNIVSEAYIRVLVKSQRFLSIPFYVQKVSAREQIPLIVSQLNPDQPLSKEKIQTFLESAAENELDVLAIGVAVVEKMRDELNVFDPNTLDWIVCCYPLVEQSNLVMLEYLRYTVLITRKYLTLGEIDLVKKLINQVTPECISDVLSVSENLNDTLVRECVCYREYLHAEAALQVWKKAMSQKPDFGHAHDQMTGSLADKALWMAKKREIEAAENKWLKIVNFHGKTAIERFMAILQFPGGWLTGCCDPSDEDENIHLNSVRRIIIKKVTYILLNLVKERGSAQTFKEFLYVLCDCHRKILEEFSPDEIGSIFKVIEDFTRTSCPNLMNLPK